VIQEYVSSELLHFVGRTATSPDAAYETLVKILREGLVSHPPHSRNVSGNLLINTDAKLSSNEMYSPEVVCFCDIPLRHLEIHMNKYSRFGISFLKTLAAEQGAVPVRYIPRQTKGTSLKFETPQITATDLDERMERIKEAVRAPTFQRVALGDLFDRAAPTQHKLFERAEDLMFKASTGVPEEVHELQELTRFLTFTSSVS
jgi:hypothetical protein